ncbi:NACHT, LRR and PYD domains-containing protein 3-like [Alosa pseudoharengus]|uniref:NACHT, LRR and PYD domains-containing protein 3-like n=1 Tax=Alosa pseudoharengus TaxID=34774 RepID=UPI003F8A339F
MEEDGDCQSARHSVKFIKNPEAAVSANSGSVAVSTEVAGNTFSGPVTFNLITECPADTVTANHKEASTPHKCDGTGSAGATSAQKENVRSSVSCDAKTDVKAAFKSDLEKRYEDFLDGNEERISLMEVYTDVEFVNSNNDPIKLSELFQVGPQQRVLTQGIVGIGKTVSVQKFILDWAKGNENKDIDFIFPVPFKYLNPEKDEQCTITELMKKFFPVIGPLESLPTGEGKVMFIFDGLDESQLNLKFDKKTFINVNDKTNVGTLISHIIQGTLLPSAFVWITSRPAAAQKIPKDCKYFVTEAKGFSEIQKEEYFRKKFGGKAGAIISTIKKSRTLHTTCGIPVFSWILANVIRTSQGTHMDGTHPDGAHTNDIHSGITVTDSTDTDKIPTSLTGVYTEFVRQLLQQVNETEQKRNQTNSAEDVSTLNILLKLGKLAFTLKGNINFKEKELTKCHILVEEATGYFGICTPNERENEGYRFVHPSVQAFLAATYCLLEHTFHGRNPFQPNFLQRIKWIFQHSLYDLLKIAVDDAMRSNCDQRDLSLRFLLGISLAPSNDLLDELMSKVYCDKLSKLTKNRETTLKRTVKYLYQKLKGSSSTNSPANLFYCLSELKDESLVREVESYLTTYVSSKDDLSPTQWSALTFVLLTSEEMQEQFQLQRFVTSEIGLKRLLPVVKTTCKALLGCCALTSNACKDLASVLEKNSHLRVLDLSNNDLRDAGVEELCKGLMKPVCKLERLELSGCLITNKGCDYLALALKSNPSHLKVLDLDYNHIGTSGEKQLSMFLDDTKYKLEELTFENNSASCLKPGLRKYACELKLDPNTAHVCLSFSEGDRKVAFVDQPLPYTDNPERFDKSFQVLCTGGQSGRCYWEAKWTESWTPVIGMAYKSTKRKGRHCKLGKSEKSWSLISSGRIYTAMHNNDSTHIKGPSTCTIGVYLNWPAGTLSFYAVSAGSLTHLHTFHHNKFTEPLYAAFSVYKSSLTIC